MKKTRWSFWGLWAAVIAFVVFFLLPPHKKDISSVYTKTSCIDISDCEWAEWVSWINQEELDEEGNEKLMKQLTDVLSSPFLYWK